jgi:penicillin-binding protein 1A
MSEKKKIRLKIPNLNLKKFKLKRIKLKNFKFNKEKRRKFFKRALLTLLILAVCFIGVLIGVYRAILQNLPDIAQLEEYEPSIVTYVYSDDEEVIGEYALQKRIPVAFDEIPDYLKEAVIATEDPRFYTHSGIDFLGILRAVKKDLKLIFTLRKLHGGSTITQQLVRELLLHRKQTIRRKIKEAILALQIEKRYSKDEIIAIYCNQFNLGHGAYGVEAAAQLFFDKSVSDLNLVEAAMIVGIFRGPSKYSPYNNYEGTLQRRNHVINRMVEEEYISMEQGEAAKQEGLNVLPLYRGDSEFAAYFREEVRKYLEQNYGVDALYKKGLKVYTTLNTDYQRYAEKALKIQLRVLDKRQGWRDDKINLIEKGIEDLDELEKPLQVEVEGKPDRYLLLSWRNLSFEIGMVVEAVVLSVEKSKADIKVKDYTGKIESKDIFSWTFTRDLRKLIKRGDLIHIEIKKVDKEKKEISASLDQEPVLDGAFLAIEPQTGQIKTMVGGYSFRRSKWNNVTQAMRQAGSVIKPFLYTAGLESGLTTASTFIDEPTDFEDKWSGELWSPPNYDEKYKGRITFRQGLEESRNIFTAKLLDHISPQTGVEYCKKFGLTSPIYPYMSLALGSFEAKMVELVSAFTVFPNGGIRIKPYYITRIEDKDGNILEECKVESEEVISPQIAYIMTSLMQGVVQRGTSQLAKFLEKPLAGKTGTTDDWADARFIGFSPSLCAGVWIGHKEGRISIGERQSGAVAALPVFVGFFNSIIDEEKRVAEENEEEVVEEEFLVPRNLSFIMVDQKTGLLPSPICQPQFLLREVFIPGTEPNRFCSYEDHMMTYDYYETLKKK